MRNQDEKISKTSDGGLHLVVKETGLPRVRLTLGSPKRFVNRRSTKFRDAVRHSFSRIPYGQSRRLSVGLWAGDKSVCSTTGDEMFRTSQSDMDGICGSLDLRSRRQSQHIQRP